MNLCDPKKMTLVILAATAMFSASGASAQSPGLVAAYSFDEGTGTTAADSSGNGNRGTLVSGATWSTTAKFGAAASFDGVNDRIDVPDSNSLDLTAGMTLEAWVRPTSNSAYRTVVLKEIPSELSYSLYAADSDHSARSSGWIRVANVSRFADGTGALPLNVYSHVAVTYNGSSLVFYVNGVATRTAAGTGSIQTSTQPLRIGGNAIWGEYFQGQIDEVRVYNRALSQSEIQTDMVIPINSGPDTTAPSVSLTAPLNGATISGTVALNANAADNVGVAGVQFKVDGVNFQEDLTAPYSVQWSTTGAGAGNHEITAVARDAAGNTTTSAIVTVTVATADTQAPTVSLTAPANGAAVSGTTAVNATAADNVGVIGVQFRLDGAALGAEDTSSPYSVQWNTTTATPGSHQVTAVARDLAGNTTTSTIATVTVSNTDTTAPTVSLTAPLNGATLSGIATFSATAADNVGVVGVQFRVDGVTYQEDATSPYTVLWSTSGASAGNHQITAVARDAAGNTTTSNVATITIAGGDTQSPSVSLSAPASGATVTGSVTISANASDNVGVVGVQFRVDGVNSGTEDTSAPYSRSWSSTTSSDGTHVLTAVARDAAGNTSTSAAVSVTVRNVVGDTQAPTVSMTAPSSGSTVSGAVTVSANASDNIGVTGVQFRLDGNNLGSEDLTAPYSVSWTTTGTSNGSHQLTAVARDAGGNVTTSTSRTVSVSNAGGISLSIDGNQRFQTMDGFGISANSASWDDGALKPAIDRLMDEGGSTIWRVVIEMADWEATNDDSNASNFNWTYYNTIYSSPRFEELWATIAYLNQKGVTGTLMLNFMGRGPNWMGGATLSSSLEDEWVETVASVVYYARNNRHLQFGLFAPNNESDWDGIEGIRMDSSQNARVMRKLSLRLDALGLGDLRLIGPDTAAITNGVNQYTPALMAEPVVMGKLDHFTYHNYFGESGGADNAIKNSAYPGKNFWMSEVSNFADAFANVGQGAASVLVWDGYDSVYNHAILAGRGSNPPNDAGNGPALLAYSTSTRLYTPRKPFYEFAQLFKFVPAGSVRVAAAESNNYVTIYAFHHPVTGRVTLVGRNSGIDSVSFTGRLTNLPDVPAFESYRTNGSVNLQRNADVAVTGGVFSFVAPAYTVFTLTYSGPADSIPPTVSVTSPLAGAVSGTVAVSSNTAVDNVGIQGVQFLLDGALLGVEDTTAPYTVQWNTTGSANGDHTLTAVARDGRGNATTSAPVVVTTSN